MIHRSEADLIARAASGAPGAVEALVARNAPRIHALAYRMLGREEDAEDVVQEAFIRAWKALPDWRAEARFSTWLHRVTVNLCRDRLRKRRDVFTDTLPEIEDPAPLPEEQTAAAQRDARLRAAIAALPDRQGEAVTLCGLEEMTNAEAAEIMGITVPAMESLLARARRNLRAALLEDEDSHVDQT